MSLESKVDGLNGKIDELDRKLTSIMYKLNMSSNEIYGPKKT